MRNGARIIILLFLLRIIIIIKACIQLMHDFMKSMTSANFPGVLTTNLLLLIVLVLEYSSTHLLEYK